MQWPISPKSLISFLKKDLNQKNEVGKQTDRGCWVRTEATDGCTQQLRTVRNVEITRETRTLRSWTNGNKEEEVKRDGFEDMMIMMMKVMKNLGSFILTSKRSRLPHQKTIKSFTTTHRAVNPPQSLSWANNQTGCVQDQRRKASI